MLSRPVTTRHHHLTLITVTRPHVVLTQQSIGYTFAEPRMEQSRFSAATSTPTRPRDFNKGSGLDGLHRKTTVLWIQTNSMCLSNDHRSTSIEVKG